jgi:hypothetical protein
VVFSQAGESLLTVQLQPTGAVTLKDELPPDAGRFAPLAESCTLQVTPLSLTLNGCPATVREPFCIVAVVFAAAVKFTVPEPVPLAVFGSTVSQLELLAAVQAQPEGAVTVTVPGPPVALKEVVPESEYEQATPDSETVNVLPAIASDPLRVLEPPLAPALKDTVPGPVPLEPPVIVTQGAPLLLAVQEQPAGVFTLTLLEPPVDGNVYELLVSENVHATPDWLTV